MAVINGPREVPDAVAQDTQDPGLELLGDEVDTGQDALLTESSGAPSLGLLSGDTAAEAATAGAELSFGCDGSTPMSRKPPNSATMTPATTNLIALNMGWNLHMGDRVAAVTAW